MKDIYDAKADDAMTVCTEMARFTVLRARMLRMEWARDSVFEDRPTLAVVNRKMPSTRFSVKKTGRKLEIKTDCLTLEYVENGKCFSADNLRVRFSLNGRKMLISERLH